jgi:hypothetical protein
MFDIARQMVHGALRCEEFLSRTDGWPSESLGRMVQALIERCWPDVPLSTLRQRLDASQSRMEAELQAALDLLKP